MQLINIQSPEEMAQFTLHPAVSRTTATQLTLHRPDAHWLAVDDGRQVLGRCSLWWKATATHNDHRLGYIGHYAAASDPVAEKLLNRASTDLSQNGCTLAVGPLDGTTWRRYRFITWRGKAPPFFLEPDNPDAWPGQFEKNGFSILADYISTLNTDLNYQDPRAEEISRRMEDQGVCIRCIDPDHLDRELDGIFELSIESFRKNFLYSPIERKEFMAMYGGVKSFLHGELTLVAEQQGRTVGFMFALPDALQAKRGQRIDQVILKTIAIRPDRALAGLGRLLFQTALSNAHKLGYRRAVHALMHAANRSTNLGQGSTVVMRRYALFSKELV